MWLIDSSIGRKLIMSISGVFLVLFLIFHSVMNITVTFSPETYNWICGILGANWYAIVGTLVIAGGFVVHILYATYLTLLNRKARGRKRYAVTGKQEGVSWSSQNMYVLGIVIVGFLIMHLYQFWYKMQFAELTGIHTGAFDPHDGAAYVTDLFGNWIYCVIYIVWLTALWLHLTHGVWSSLHTIGLNNKTWMPRVKVIGNIISTIVILMFMAVPVYFLFTNLICG
ncbi:MAG: succinate dehydrogenase cytochrome b subunit [Prevotellaceae bacterium]|jgi:succinate dehydrogenase / fumarate reductase cytochrome b subunit|nr:succinate dehydrogenase cytochrome b subunit [Prevotellaceae bacterium]